MATVWKGPLERTFAEVDPTWADHPGMGSSSRRRTAGPAHVTEAAEIPSGRTWQAAPLVLKKEVEVGNCHTSATESE
jgi:hypothetical protein